MSALEQKLLFCFPKKNQMCKKRSNYYHYYCLICSMWRGIKRWNVQKTYKQLFLSVLCQVKDKKRGKQWFSRGTAKCVSTFPSSLRVTSAAPQTAGRRSRLQQPYSSATPLKSGPPETGKKKTGSRCHMQWQEWQEWDGKFKLDRSHDIQESWCQDGFL